MNITARRLTCLLMVAFLPLAQAAESGQPETHIVFLSGPKDHGIAGRHE